MTRQQKGQTGLISAIMLAGGMGIGFAGMTGCDQTDPPPPGPPQQDQQPPAQPPPPGQAPDQQQQRDRPQPPGGPESDPYGGSSPGSP